MATATETSKQTVGLIHKKKTTLDVQHTFFVHLFAVFHDDNVKPPETSQLHALWRKCCLLFCSLFLLTPIYTLVAASISHFIIASYYSNELISFVILSLALALALSRISTPM